MEDKPLIFVMISLLMFALLIFSNLSFTGHVIEEDNLSNVNRSEAIFAIADSKEIISEMQDLGFQINYSIDILFEAENIFQQVDYAEILKGNINSTEKERIDARRALSLIQWRDLDYSNVLNYTDLIVQRKKDALFILDQISVEEKKLDEVSFETAQILEDAKTAFRDEQYSTAQDLLKKFQEGYESEISQKAGFSGIKYGAMNFFQRYWIYLLIFLGGISLLVYFLYKLFRKKILKRRIRKMKSESIILKRLIEETQKERFKNNSISGLVYNIRIKKYKERLQDIDRVLPVLEKNVKR